MMEWYRDFAIWMMFWMTTYAFFFPEGVVRRIVRVVKDEWRKP